MAFASAVGGPGFDFEQGLFGIDLLAGMGWALDDLPVFAFRGDRFIAEGPAFGVGLVPGLVPGLHGGCYDAGQFVEEGFVEPLVDGAVGYGHTEAELVDFLDAEVLEGFTPFFVVAFFGDGQRRRSGAGRFLVVILQGLVDPSGDAGIDGMALHYVPEGEFGEGFGDGRRVLVSVFDGVHDGGGHLEVLLRGIPHGDFGGLELFPGHGGLSFAQEHRAPALSLGYVVGRRVLAQGRFAACAVASA